MRSVLKLASVDVRRRQVKNETRNFAVAGANALFCSVGRNYFLKRASIYFAKLDHDPPVTPASLKAELRDAAAFIISSYSLLISTFVRFPCFRQQPPAVPSLSKSPFQLLSTILQYCWQRLLEVHVRDCDEAVGQTLNRRPIVLDRLVAQMVELSFGSRSEKRHSR